MNLSNVNNVKLIGHDASFIGNIIFQKDRDNFIVKKYKHSDSIITTLNIDSVDSPKAYFGYLQIPSNSWPGLDVGDITPVLYIEDQENHQNDQYYYICIWGLEKKVGNYSDSIKNVVSLADIFKANRDNYGSGSRTECIINITNGSACWSLTLTGTSFIVTNEGTTSGFDNINTITLNWTQSTGVMVGLINGTDYSNIIVINNPSNVNAWKYLISSLSYETANSVKQLHDEDETIHSDLDNLEGELTGLIESVETRVNRIESQGISSYVSR